MFMAIILFPPGLRSIPAGGGKNNGNPLACGAVIYDGDMIIWSFPEGPTNTHNCCAIAQTYEEARRRRTRLKTNQAGKQAASTFVELDLEQRATRFFAIAKRRGKSTKKRRSREKGKRSGKTKTKQSKSVWLRARSAQVCYTIKAGWSGQRGGGPSGAGK